MLAERISLRAQMPDQLADRGHDVHRGTAPGPAPRDLRAAERNAELAGLGQQDPARRGIPTPMGLPRWRKAYVDRLLHTQYVRDIMASEVAGQPLDAT